MKIQNFGKPLSRLIIMVAICMLSLHAMAYDFSYTYQGKTLYYNITSSNTVQVANYNSVSGAVVIPSSVTNNGTTYSVTSIGYMAFYECSGLTSVTIPNSVTSIGADAFYECSRLTSVTIPNSVISIGNSAFAGCSSLTSVTIPNSLIHIGNYAFRSCSGLISITIPNSVTSIGKEAFYGCSSLTSITIPNSVTSIANYTFCRCSSLTSVTIPNSVTSIGEEAFYECSSLTSVTIPNSVTSIGDDVFFGCSSLTSVTIPNSVTSIGYRVFKDCTSLTSVTIPNSVTSIGNSAFSGCSSLTSVTIPNSVTSIGDHAFYGCNGLTSVTIPNSVTSIGGSVFSGCSSLTSVTIPNSVTSIGMWAFYYCSSLTSVTIPNSVTSIGEEAFYECWNLTSIVSNAVVPPAIGNAVFPYANTCNVTVPCGSLEAYMASSWNIYFPSRITEVLSFDLSVAANNDSFGSVSVETLSCNVRTLTATPSSCKSFVAWNDGNTDNPRTVTITSDTSFTAIFESVEISNDITAAICQGSAYTENGFNVSDAGVYTQNLQTINGCDSVVTLTLTVNPVATTALQAAICQGETYTENGFNVSEAGVYTQNLQTINGCDSVVTLTLTVNHVATTALQAAICEGTAYTENGFNVSEAGVYTQNLQTINGCDSTVTLTLTVNPVATTALQAAICEGTAYTENGFNVSEAGVYTQNLQTINGCDSVVTLTLTVNPVATTALQAAICEGTAYTENGFNVSEAGVYTQNLQTINGCDSTVTLTLTVNPVATTNLTAAICEGTAYTENGFNVSEAGVYTQNLQTINGCDSVVTLTLTVNPVATTALQAAICEGTSYTENGFNVSQAGTYTQNLQTVNGCDSIVTLTLTVNPVATTTLQAAICEGTAYTENGFNVSEAGVYTQNLQTINGCDSVVTLTLTVNPIYNFTIDATINQGETYHGNGFEVSEAGTYTQNLQTVNGCDSVIVLNLTVNSSLGDVVAKTIEVALYPNPAENYTVLEVQGLKEQTKVALFDVRGRKLREFDLSAGTESVRLDLRDLPSGVYTLMIGNTTKKLIVE